MGTLHTIARTIRHTPGLKRLDPLWRAARVPYYALARLRGGVTMTLGGAPVFVPLRFADQGWDSYERVAMRSYVQWVRSHPHGTVFDVGCFIGLYTYVALAVSKTLNVVAIDADLASIVTMAQLTRDVSGNRLTALRCLVGQTPSNALLGFGECSTETTRQLAGHPGTASPQYTCLGTTTQVPIYRLDSFTPADTAAPILVKMDIEGAELLALHGAEAILARPNVSLLLSVHANLMGQYGCTRGMLEQFLVERGYQSTVLDIDHEEHWWVSRANSSDSHQSLRELSSLR